MHQGYKLKQNGFKKPAETHFSKNLTLNKKSAKVKIPESTRGEKGWKKICLLTMILLK